MATDIDFPKNLPTPQRSGYELTPVATFARTTMASGRAKQRRMHTSVPTMVPVAFLLTQQQALVFEAWFKYDIDDGVAWFNCVLDSPSGLKPYECRFTDMYKGPQRVGSNRWLYRAEFEIFERPIISEDWYRIGLDYILYASILDVAINREKPAP